MRPSRQTRYARAHDLDSWRTDERIAARGFAHRWESVVADGNGEDFFLQLLDQHLTASPDVLDIGRGHGEFALSIAGRARSVVGVERHQGLLDLAGELLAESGLGNVRLDCPPTLIVWPVPAVCGLSWCWPVLASGLRWLSVGCPGAACLDRLA